MYKKSLLSEIYIAIDNIETVIKNERKEDLRAFINDLENLKVEVINDEVKSNILRGFARRYADMYNDYLNPITNVLDRMEKAVDSYLEKEI
ncbi:hypothetical protein ACWXVW_11140 [Pantoea dispersa]|uniref:hypothetical protein n=1 Tax=Pantoea dispersa TaxID=59814 RepID=UPI002DB793B1|nr:hypothetical protein [Pantoea dispersa]MEB5972977.1 hypothetical protein [Pantoea dispersa]